MLPVCGSHYHENNSGKIPCNNWQLCTSKGFTNNMRGKMHKVQGNGARVETRIMRNCHFKCKVKLFVPRDVQVDVNFEQFMTYGRHSLLGWCHSTYVVTSADSRWMITETPKQFVSPRIKLGFNVQNVGSVLEIILGTQMLSPLNEQICVVHRP